MVGTQSMRSRFGATRTRRALAVGVVALAVAAVTTACGGDRTASKSEADPSVAVQMAWLPNVQAAGEYVADAKGYFTDAGIDVDLTPGGPNANPVQLVAAGKADIGVTYAPTLMLARNEGIPVKAFGAAMQRAPLAYFSLTEQGITSVEDLAGKKIGIQVGGEALLESMLRNNGMELSDVKTVTVGADFTPLIQKQVDVFAAWEINLEQIAPAADLGLNKLLLFENGTKFQSNYYIVTDDTLDGDTDQLTAFLQASAKGWEYALENPEEAVEILLKVNPALDHDLQLEQLTDYLPGYVMGGAAEANGFGWMDEAMWTDATADFQEFGMIGEDVTSADLYTMDVLKAADLAGGSGDEQ